MEKGRKLMQVNRRNLLSGESVLDFLERLEKTRAFFKPFLDADDFTRPEFVVSTEFRIRRDNEAGASNIIEWLMGLGPESIRYMEKKNQSVWRYGDPVNFSIRWAKNAPVVPLPSSDAPGMTVVGRTVNYEFNSNWSLLHFIREYRAGLGDFLVGKRQKPHVLKFEIDTVPATTGEAGAAGSTYVEPTTARLFVRVVLAAPVKDAEGRESLATLTMPQFPDFAPELKLKSQQAAVR